MIQNTTLSMWILCSVWKMIFPSIWRSFQRLHKVDRNGISYHINIILLNRRENVWFFLYSRNSTGVYSFPNFHIFKQFPFQIPYNLDHFFPILNYRHGMCFRASSVFVLSILFRFPQRTHYFWRVFRFLYLWNVNRTTTWHL